MGKRKEIKSAYERKEGWMSDNSIVREANAWEEDSQILSLSCRGYVQNSLVLCTIFRDIRVCVPVFVSSSTICGWEILNESPLR